MNKKLFLKEFTYELIISLILFFSDIISIVIASVSVFFSIYTIHSVYMNCIDNFYGFKKIFNSHEEIWKSLIYFFSDSSFILLGTVLYIPLIIFSFYCTFSRMGYKKRSVVYLIYSMLLSIFGFKIAEFNVDNYRYFLYGPTVIFTTIFSFWFIFYFSYTKSIKFIEKIFKINNVTNII